MYRTVFRAFCLLVVTALSPALVTQAYSQPSAPPQIEVLIRASQRGDQQALRRVVAPTLYRAIAQRGRDRKLDALGEVESVAARRIGFDRRVRVVTYDVNVVHENGTSHWIVRLGSDGRRVAVVAFRMDASNVAVATPIRRGMGKGSARRAMKNGHGSTIAIPPTLAPGAPSATPSGGNVIPGTPTVAPIPPRPSMLPPPPAPAPAPPPVVATAPPPSAGAPPYVHARDGSAARRPPAPGPRGPTAAPSRPPFGGAPPPAAANGGSPDPSAMRRIGPGMGHVEGPIAGSSTPPPAARNGGAVVPGAAPSTPAPSIDVRPAPPPAPTGPTAPTTTTAVRPEPRVVDFLFATSRARDTSVATVAFSGQRAPGLTFGAASIRIPEDHKIGEITLPSVWRVGSFIISEERRDEKKHFVVRALKILTADEWSEAIRTKDPKSALIFVHGYNTSFEDALYRNAQIVWDLRYDGLSVLYSWASWGDALQYLYDRESAFIGRDGFIEVLRILKEKHGIETVNVIAHSMGNQVVLDSLSSYARTSNPAKIGELILAAPDVDRDMFVRLVPDVQKVVKGITLYASSTDKALSLSRGLAGVVRAGDIGPDGPIILENVQTIDVTAMGEEMFGLNHNVFAASRNLIEDIAQLLTRGLRPPDQRLRQIRPFPEPPDAPRYWRYAQ